MELKFWPQLLQKIVRRPSYDDAVEFEAWLKAPRKKTESILAAAMTNAINNGEKTRVFKDLRERLDTAKANPACMLELDVVSPVFDDIFREPKCTILHVQIERPISIVAARIETLLLTGDGPFELTNCDIGTLSVPAHAADISIANCRIGKVKLGSATLLKRLRWRRGYLSTIEIEKPAHVNAPRNPMSGDISFHRVSIVPSATSHSIQWLRTARMMLTEKGNLPAAGVFYAAEMVAIEPGEPFMNRIATRASR